ncbi:HAD family hydrolase [Haladaptatus sp. CMSO5]|uniref:HAD family hydrolase n=1 Tax=Haladaptatus sp. CMSO5 TaxID=3120514 RepID=UPI002FCE60BA
MLFDMDGVIVDSQAYWSGYEHDRIFPKAVSGDIEPEDITGMNVEDLYDHLDEHYETKLSKEAFLDCYDETATQVYREDAALMDGFHDLVATLRERGHSVALVSSSQRNWIQMVLDEFELADSFDRVVSAQDIDAASKPAPDIFLHAAELLDVPPEDCVVVEDSTHGVDAAVTAGMYCIGYQNEGSGQDLTKADEVVTSPADLRRALLD